MKKFLLLVFIILPAIGFAQTFEHAVGLRGGLTSGFEYRFYTDDANSYKFLLGTRDNGMQLHALKEFHQYDLFNASDRLVLFYGAGIHVGYERWHKHYLGNNMSWYDDQTSFLAGLDGLVGIEYLFYEAPVSLGFEAKPFFDLFGYETFNIQLFDFAFTIKYLF